MLEQKTRHPFLKAFLRDPMFKPCKGYFLSFLRNPILETLKTDPREMSSAWNYQRSKGLKMMGAPQQRLQKGRTPLKTALEPLNKP